MRHHSAPILALAMVVATAQNLRADTTCDSIAQLMAGEASTFILQTRRVDCTRSRELGGSDAVQCGWPFAYRAAAATQAFEKLTTDVSVCGIPIDTTAQDVSHPDSYDLREFTMGAGTLRVALKDKGALQQTYVFLRVSSP